MLDKHLVAKTEPKALLENIVRWKDIRITVISNRLFRIEQDEQKRFCDEATQAVWFRNMPKNDFTVLESEEHVVVKTKVCTLIVFSDINKSCVILNGKEIRILDIQNLDGTCRTLDGYDGDIRVRKNGAVDKIEKLGDGIVSACGVGVMDDTHSLILASDGMIHERNDDQMDIYIFVHGEDYRGAIKDLYMISGNVPMIPRYAFGNWWSRYHAYSDQEYLHILDKLADRDIPITVATIDMDWHWSTTLDEKKEITASGKNDEYHGGNKGWTGYSWNTDLFPDYKSFLKKIQNRNLKITLNLHPADGIRYFEDMYKEMAVAVGIDPESEQRIPFDFTSDDFINAYFKILHKPYERDGVEFWWIDWQQGKLSSIPGLDPLWSLNHYHTLDNATNHMPMILSRYCGIGSHRYPLGFSGDTIVTWKTLKFLPYFTSTATNAGYTWWSHDIGGHMNGFKDDELYLRFVQFGVFSPINRLHCSNNIVATKETTVYMNGSGLIAEEFLRLRHRMIPFLYSVAYDTHTDGRALIEPMYYEYPKCEDAYKCSGQYMFGGQLIVAPITERSDNNGMTSKRVWLPQGHWTDVFTGDEYEGGGYVEMVRWLDSFPVLAKEGGFFLLDGRKHTNDINIPDILNVMVFNGNGEYTLHEDVNGSYMNTVFRSTEENGKQILRISIEGDKSVMSERTYKFEFRNIPKGNIKAFADGKDAPFEYDVGEYLTVILREVRSDAVYTIEIDHKRNCREYRNSRLLYSFMRIQGEYQSKRNWYSCMIDYDDEQCYHLIDTNSILTDNEKKRLKEAW